MSRQRLCPGRRAGQGKDPEDRPGVVVDLDILKTIWAWTGKGAEDRPGVVAEATPALPPRLATHPGSGTADTRYRYSMNATRIVFSMSTRINRRITLASRPTGAPKVSDFATVDDPVPEPGDGEMLLRTLSRKSTCRVHPAHRAGLLSEPSRGFFLGSPAPCEAGDSPAAAAATPRARRSSERPRDALPRGRPDGPSCGSPATSTRTREPAPRACDPPGPTRPSGADTPARRGASFRHRDTPSAQWSGIQRTGRRILYRASGATGYAVIW